MVLKDTQIQQLSEETQQKLLLLLYTIEDELLYNCKSVSKTINELQLKVENFKINKGE